MGGEKEGDDKEMKARDNVGPPKRCRSVAGWVLGHQLILNIEYPKYWRIVEPNGANSAIPHQAGFHF